MFSVLNKLFSEVSDIKSQILGLIELDDFVSDGGGEFIVRVAGFIATIE